LAGKPPENPDHLFALAEELRRRFSSIERNLGSTIDQMDRELHQLREGAERLRLISASSLFVALERMARDTAQTLSRQVTFEASGGDIRLDSHVIETIQGALIQLVRNAWHTESNPKASGQSRQAGARTRDRRGVPARIAHRVRMSR